MKAGIPRVASASGLDVVVVGAGLAGLTAARRLAERGLDVAVLEARDRVGGRTFSFTSPHHGVIDLGAQWIGPTQDRVAALATEFGLRTFDQYSTGAKLLSLDREVSISEGPIPKLPLVTLFFLDRMIKRLKVMSEEVPIETPHTAARAAEWDGITVESWKRTTVVTRKSRALLDIAVRGIFAAEPGEISFLYFLFYLHSGGGLLRLTQAHNGAQHTRFTTGTQPLSTRLAELLEGRVVLNAPVQVITQDPTGVRVRSDVGELRGRYAIVATPPALAGRIAYDPPLPAARDQLTQRMPMGSVLKCVVFYERPFWRDDGLSGEAFSNTGPVTMVFDDSPEDGSHGALLAFVVGDQARHWGARPVAERRQAVVSELTRLFGSRAALSVDYVDKDWASETWSRGCYTGLMPPGTLTAYGSALRAPVGRIHWAGTETASVWNGYMDGAIESGERAAREILLADKTSPMPR